ncbi:MAG: heterodisulfide reductase-related iron-sulfur binding cluster [candidate division WOR-3 bacterium]
MKEAIFPGCSLTQSAKDYYYSTKIILRYLGKEIEELPEWECCGATILPSVSKKDFEEVNKRNIERATLLKIKRLISPCSSCFINLKKFSENKVEIIHLLYYLYEMKDKIKLKVKDKKDLKIIPYYGCQTLRPFGKENVWNPFSMDEIIEICGFKVVNFPYKTKCCGGVVSQIEPYRGNEIIKEIFEDFVEKFDIVSTICPLCRINLEFTFLKLKFKKPVLYLTQIIGISFEINERELFLNKSLISFKIK